MNISTKTKGSLWIVALKNLTINEQFLPEYVDVLLENQQHQSFVQMLLTPSNLKWTPELSVCQSVSLSGGSSLLLPRD